jgi:hypothetical protein
MFDYKQALQELEKVCDIDQIDVFFQKYLGKQ